MNFSEKIVKRVLEAAFPGSALIYRTEQSNNEYDFDWRYISGDSAALEVTTLLDESWMKTQAAIHGKRSGGSVISCIECKKTWIIFPNNGANVTKIKRDSDRLIAEFERRGVDEINYLRSYSDPAVSQLCNELQINQATVLVDEGSKILIGSLIRGETVDRNSAIRAAQELAVPANTTKLGKAKAAERHLAVYIDARAGGAWISLFDFEPPDVKPTLPPEITNLWLIGHAPDPNRFIVWGGSTSQEFSAMTVNCDISDLLATATPPVP
jgi:hypothetical protein